MTQAIIVVSIENPKINTWLLDKFLVSAEYENLHIKICINKVELNREEAHKIKDIYEEAGYDVFLTSVIENEGLDKVKELLKDNITVLAGPSGVGKSSILNQINPEFTLETGSISDKTKRGKHTTRHVELLELDVDSYVLDTPGFSALDLGFIEDEGQVKFYFREIDKFGSECRFMNCIHDKEPNCNVKKKVEEGQIDEDRYNNYLSLVEEIKNKRRY